MTGILLIYFFFKDCKGDIDHSFGIRCHKQSEIILVLYIASSGHCDDGDVYLIFYIGLPPLNVNVVVLGNHLNITWEKPLSGIRNVDPVVGYSIECYTSFALEGSIQYKVNRAVDNTSTSIALPLESNNLISAYNCCVEAKFNTYSSIACASDLQT